MIVCCDYSVFTVFSGGAGVKAHVYTTSASLFIPVAEDGLNDGCLVNVTARGLWSRLVDFRCFSLIVDMTMSQPC